MQPIKDLINQIKWDERKDPDEYTLVFIDMKKDREVPYTSIKRLEGNFMVLDKEDEEVEIPLHRIRKVKKLGKVVWQRG